MIGSERRGNGTRALRFRAPAQPRTDERHRGGAGSGPRAHIMAGSGGNRDGSVPPHCSVIFSTGAVPISRTPSVAVMPLDQTLPTGS